MTSVATRPLTIDEFLARPEAEEPSLEFLRGEVIEKPMASHLHGRATSQLIIRFGVYLQRTKEGQVINEVRHADRAQDWVYLPDVNIELRRDGSRRPQARGPVEVVPDIAIEVLSPDDRISRWVERVNLYLAAGTQLLWVVDPQEETIRVFRPGQQSFSARAGDILDASPVLREFELDVAEFFETIREPL